MYAANQGTVARWEDSKFKVGASPAHIAEEERCCDGKKIGMHIDGKSV